MNSPYGVFPDEITLQILSRLPIKSLLKTKVVCKLWYRLISHKRFTNLYNELSVKNPMVLVQITEPSLESRASLICVDNLKGVSPLSLDFIEDRVKVRGSCNGLICLSSIPDKGVYYVCNPFTREYKLLPRSEERPITRFHPDGEATLVGLACDLIKQKYNVVLAGYHVEFGHRPERTFICMVYDSESNKWRKFVSLQILDDQFTHMNKNQVVFINGGLHWLTDSCSCMLILDLATDVWRKIQLPNEISREVGSRIYFLELDGRLSVIQIYEDWMVIWVMEDYEREEWKTVDKVSLRFTRGMVRGIIPISQNDNYVYLATHNQVLIYQRNNRVWKEVFSVKDSSTLPLWLSAHAFRSTLFSCR